MSGSKILALRRTMDNAETLLKKINGHVDPLADSATHTLSAVQKTLTDLRLGIQNLTALTESDAPLRTDLALTLEQLKNAARAIAELAEFLERNPNALLTGRKPRKDNP